MIGRKAEYFMGRTKAIRLFPVDVFQAIDGMLFKGSLIYALIAPVCEWAIAAYIFLRQHRRIEKK